MGFPTAILGWGSLETFRDEFTRNNSTNVSNGWHAPGWSIASNELQFNSGGGYCWSGSSQTADGYAECIPKDDEIGPMIRQSTSLSSRGYMAAPYNGGDNIGIFRWSGGWLNMANVGGGPHVNFSTDVLRLEAFGTSLRAYVNEQLKVSTTSTHYQSAGVRGVSPVIPSSTATKQVDSYAEGDALV